MRNLIVLLGLVAITAFGASAQTDAKAKAVLGNLSKKLASLKSLRANFTLGLTGANGKGSQSRKGSFVMKGQKYRVQLGAQEIICDSKTVWTYMKEANEVQVSNYNPNDQQALSPAKLFTNFYEKEYASKYLGERTVNGKKCDVVELVPLNKSKQLTKIELAVDKASGTIAGGNIWEKTGNRYQYTVSGFTPNTEVGDNTFVFNKNEHPGVEVVDLR